MKIKKAHCFFEQSGTFKNAFKHYGIDAEDYDIQNNFDETDNVIDLFAEIEKGYDGKPSIFDRIEKDDLIMAFFPCIMFCGISQMNITLNTYLWRNKTLQGADKYIFDRIEKREYFYRLLLKLCFTCISRNIKLVIENPYTTNTYLKGNFIKPPDIIDEDRTRRGDYMVKPTAYWFFNCEPTRGFTPMKCPESKRKYFAIHTDYSKPKDQVVKSGKSGLCSEERSMISPDYALNFINDFLLGGGQRRGVIQQNELF